MSNDVAELTLLSLANAKGKFGLQIGAEMSEEEVAAFERGIELEWFLLVDVNYIKNSPGIFRVFMLTYAGFERLAVLKQVVTP